MEDYCWPILLIVVLTMEPWHVVGHESEMDAAISPLIVEKRIGDSANITCRITRSSSTIWFNEESTGREIRQPSANIIILDDSTAVLVLRNMTEINTEYKCLSRGNAFGITRVYVGSPPTDVKNFSCLNYDYDGITCKFDAPVNPVFIKYKMQYTIDDDTQTYNCSCTLNGHEGLPFFQGFSCNVTTYLPTRDIYNFTLIGENALGKNRQSLVMYNRQDVKPAELELNHISITDSSITLNWYMRMHGYYNDDGLEYLIEIKPQGFDWYRDQSKEQCNNGICEVTINNLKFSNHAYYIRIRSKVKMNTHNVWSEPFVYNFTTDSRAPDFPPNTIVGSYHIDSSERAVRLYWDEIPDNYKNGPDFEYVIREIDMNGHIKNIKKTKETNILFNWDNRDIYDYHIKASNINNESIGYSVIRVYPTKMNSNSFSSETIYSVYNDRRYKVTWKPPVDQGQLESYSIFWCSAKIESTNQCKDIIHFKLMDKNATSFITDPQDNTLNMAVSANFVNHTTGMMWARCSADISSELLKLEPEIIALNSTSLLVQWTSDRICPSIAKGYNLSYCLISDDSKYVLNGSPNCLMPPKSIITNYLYQYLNDLIPNALYRIEMFMYSDFKQSNTSDPIYKRTDEAAPSPPRSLLVDRTSITSHSADLSWQSPLITNGVIRSYTIFYKPDHERTYSHINSNEIEIHVETEDTNSVQLKNLYSFTKYEVCITAHTTEASNRSESITFSTLIGIPSSPINLQVEEGHFSTSVFKWDSPQIKSGRVEFYITSLVSNMQSGETDEQMEVVTGTSMRFDKPNCNYVSTYMYRVRAVNLVKKEEFDYITFPFAYNPLDRRKNKKIGIETYLHCINSDFNNGNFKLDDNFSKNLIGNRSIDDFQFFCSPWVENQSFFKCVPLPKYSMLWLPFIGLFFSILISYILYWLKCKYNKMKNIKAVLPDALKYHFDTKPHGGAYENKIKNYDNDVFHSPNCMQYEGKDVSRLLDSSQQCFQQNEPTQINLNFNSEKVTNRNIENHSDEDASSASTNTLELNDVNNAAVLATENDIPSNNVSELISDIKPQPTLQINSFSDENDISGYVQPHTIAMAIEANTNGYSTFDSISKCIIPAITSTSTSPVPSDDLSSYVPIHSKFKQLPSLNDSLTNSGNNNNANCGYVLPRQIGEFSGQLLY